jgi:hypothetical protein
MTPLNPIETIIDAGKFNRHTNGKPVDVCGVVAGDDEVSEPVAVGSAGR